MRQDNENKKEERDTLNKLQISPQSEELELFYRAQAELRAKYGTEGFWHIE